MSELKKIRETKNLTQEELAEKSGISVRTIQRIEAGTNPKGYTLKTLAASLDVSEQDLLIAEIVKEEIKVEEISLTTENDDSLNLILIKIINLSSLPLAWLPIANFLPPLLIMLFTKNKSQIVKQIISLQIFLAIISPIIFMLIALLKLGSESVMVTMIFLVLANVYIILRNTFEIDKKKRLCYKLNFNII
ncbi:helix-turn-helix domain-containing protein [Chryseobacterium sp. LC2016-29]|uniref:helix-turn-helix domain-containing protein n=1 Tax=Chryseobacterium sp. LC2016-29 TaxID=2897331 RepID=UPI001E4C55CC|nr:helix-turn-helix domain-containing protein [Chryseobacterium sp. LC2016-29]MCD0480084.1 helix-turn-helix domain-containing protein [Chryseobacterium sp. LC2016-29]